MPLPIIQENQGRSFIETAKGVLRGILTCLGTGRRGGNCDGQFSSYEVRPLLTEGLYERKNMVVAYVVERKLRVINLIDREKLMLVAIMGNIEFFYLHSRTCSLKVTVTGRCYNLSNLFFHIGRWGQFLAGRWDWTLWNHRLSVSRKVFRQTHVAKR